MLRLAVAAVLTLAAAQALAARTAPPADYAAPGDDGQQLDPAFVDEPSQEPDAFESAMINMDPRTYLPAAVAPDLAQANLRAVLDTIAACEGTAGADGYRTMFGYRYFDSFADHPRQFFEYTNLAGRTVYTSAAGRYQIIVRTWDALRARLGLVDFSPASQDAAAIELIRERGALQDAYAGRIGDVINKCAPTWASLPGSNVAQPMRSFSWAVAAYQHAGGTLA